MIKTETERDSFVKANLGLVHSCANKFRGKGIEYDDLYGAGCIGLIKAFDSFDENRGVMFSTYAVPVILGEIKRLFRDGGAVKVSRGLKELSLKVVREREYFLKRNGREITITELSEKLETPQEDIIEALNVSLPPVSLTTENEDGTTEIDIPDESNDEHICDIISLNEVIRKLDDKGRQLIVLRYYKGKTQVETAKLLSMTQVQVSRMEKKLLELLRLELIE